LADQLGVVVLAAGQGTRMNSDVHKVLHTVAGLPMIDHVLRSAAPLQPLGAVLVIGWGAEQLRTHLGDRVKYAIQDSPLGTGDAVRVALPHLPDRVRTVLVLYGDTPLVTPETLQRLVRTHADRGPLVTILTAANDDPGRILRDGEGRVTGVVEQKLATEAQLGIPERNSGVCAFRADWLREQLAQLEQSSLGEYLLTDLIGKAVEAGEQNGRWPVESVQVGSPEEAMGVNTQRQLADAEAALRRLLLDRLMSSGVTVHDPHSTYVGVDVSVGRDTVLLPGTHLEGSVVVGERCRLGPGAHIRDSRIGDGCVVRWSVVEDSTVGENSDIGPYSHLRPGSRIGDGVHVGNFVETKNTSIGDGSASGHFSYLGDAEIGANVNIGAGTITANFDGEQKHQTVIGDGAFIGSDTILRAPVTIGPGARTGAGSVVTRDVPAGRTVVGMPARQAPQRAAGAPSASENSNGEGDADTEEK